MLSSFFACTRVTAGASENFMDRQYGLTGRDGQVWKLTVLLAL